MPLLLVGCVPAVRANTVVFATGAQLLGGYAENAQATFDINNTTHTITVHLLNLQLNPTDVDQAIGSLRFTLTGAGNPTPTSTTPTGISDTILDINNSGTPTKVAAETIHGLAGQCLRAGFRMADRAVCGLHRGGHERPDHRRAECHHQREVFERGCHADGR